MTYTLIELLLVNNAGGNRPIPNTFDHRDEGVAGERVRQRRTTTVDVNHARGNLHVIESRFNQQRIKLATDQGIAVEFALHLNQALDRGLR